MPKAPIPNNTTEKKTRDQNPQLVKNDSFRVEKLNMNENGVSLRMDSRSRISNRDISPPKNLADMRAIMKSKKLAEINSSDQAAAEQTKDNLNNLNKKIDDFQTEFKKHRKPSEERSPQKRHAVLSQRMQMIKEPGSRNLQGNSHQLSSDMIPMSETIGMAAPKNRQRWSKKHTNNITKDLTSNALLEESKLQDKPRKSSPDIDRRNENYQT